MSRDWRAYLNGLAYCHGCGRFGLHRAGAGARVPVGWKMLYQPHADAPPMLLACGDPCVALVREAMVKGPVLEPLRPAAEPMMSAEMHMQMMEEFHQFLRDQLEEEFPSANDPPDRSTP